jgi:hypothetical protein
MLVYDLAMGRTRGFDQGGFQAFIPVLLFDAIRRGTGEVQKFGDIQRGFAFIQ